LAIVRLTARKVATVLAGLSYAYLEIDGGEREGFEPNSDPVTYQQLTESDENSDPPIVLFASRSVQVCAPQSVPVKHWRGYPTLGSTTWQLKKRAKESPRHFCRRPFISD